MTLSRLLFTAFLLAIQLATKHVNAEPVVIVTEIDGKKTQGVLKSWSTDQLQIAGTSLHEFPRPNIRALDFEIPLKKLRGGQPLIWLANGDRISARPVTIHDDRLTVSWHLSESHNLPEIPLENIAAVIFELPAAISDRLRLYTDLETLPPGSDVVMLTNGDRVTGEIEQLDAAFIELKTPSGALKLDRGRVRAIRFNPDFINSKRTTGRRVLVTLSDGSRLASANLEAKNDALQIKTLSFGTISFPWTSIHKCEFFGERLIPLTDYEPAKVEFVPFLSSKWTIVQNANILHGPLSLRKKEFSTGLGMHTRMSVSYNLRGNENSFQSFVGIDDVANGAGSVVFAVELDGHTAWTSPEVTGQSDVLPIPEIDLRGCKRMTLIVNYGQFADVSDYADWCDPILILNPIP